MTSRDAEVRDGAPIGRLFWKVLLAFWLTLLSAVAVIGTLLWLHQRDAQREATLAAGPRAELMLQSAGATLRHGGPAALAALLSEPMPRGGPALYAVDVRDQDLLGRPVPPEALMRARQLASRTAAGRPAAGGASVAARAIRWDERSGLLLFVTLPDDMAEQGPRRMAMRRPAPPQPLSPWVFVATGLLASLAFSALLAWYLTRPIRHLRRAFAAVAEGRLETRVAPRIGRRTDEIADLGHDFDRMAGQLQQLIAAQRRLLHDVSHELRSPLARLHAAIGLARQDPQRADAMLERIEREAVRLDRLVGELLTLARLEAGQSSPAREHTDVVELLAGLIDDARFEAQARQRDVRFSAPPDAFVDADSELLHRAFENVVRNAIHHTREGTVVEVTAHRDEARHRLIVTVDDHGPGVAADELPRIFEPFHRSSGSPGFGLGLAIARRAVEAHGGRISAENRAGNR
ncbi:MAG: sensor histidine kinase, partial [Burkholderiaceae bacterium]